MTYFCVRTLYISARIYAVYEYVRGNATRKRASLEQREILEEWKGCDRERREEFRVRLSSLQC